MDLKRLLCKYSSICGTVDKKVGMKLWRQRNTLSEEDVAETHPQRPCFVKREHKAHRLLHCRRIRRYSLAPCRGAPMAGGCQGSVRRMVNRVSGAALLHCLYPRCDGLDSPSLQPAAVASVSSSSARRASSGGRRSSSCLRVPK